MKMSCYIENAFKFYLFKVKKMRKIGKLSKETLHMTCEVFKK